VKNGARERTAFLGRTLSTDSRMIACIPERNKDAGRAIIYSCVGMAFQLTVSEGGWRADVFQKDGAYLVTINFGYDSETRTTYSVVVGLEPLPGGDMEYFC
jgi:hypothetical protein